MYRWGKTMNVPIIFSIGLAELFGLFLFIIALVLFTRRDYYQNVFNNTKSNNPIIMLTAIIGLLAGMILIGVHGGFEFKYRAAISVICWLIFINALLWLMIPEKMLNLIKKTFNGKCFYGIVIFIGISGLWLIIRGSELFIFKEGIVGLLQ